ncbi:MAG TPA: GNAT family N-acetyltransferase, partial [Acidimicrobiia bacterium]
ELDLFRRQIARPVEAPEWPIRQPRRPPWGAANRVDRDSFEPLWRLGELGLKEAFDAISRSVFLAVGDAEELAGFAIVGTGGGIGYLQRIAVHPNHRRRGIGRALVRAAFHFVHRHGGHSILLNTQPDNQAAAALYESEGFVRDRSRLLVLRSR